MILTLENTVGQPTILFDAEGVPINYCTYCNTETGEVEVYDMNAYRPGMFEVPTVIQYRPAPIRVIITEKKLVD
jgi:hypothetical protein